MNFLGIGLPEIVLISLIAVVVLGPERFPEAAVQVARAIKWLRGYATENTRDLRHEFAELTREYEEMREELDEVRQAVSSGISVASDELNKVIKETKPALEAARPDRLAGDNEPIIEPGGELPPEPDRSDNGA
ncbi:MAG: twin-arginine translocase TatA/TatE family subunit [Chloroflexi bacterium]|nr:twin-arginine translocase TatA/TatE family subunit [Chloroflexota bacterium]MCI0783655.1 twin-arginine translocase TatA/TatE family subunit [Chloroflexota bacterium]MCI0814336.1 twin-arginine translocase TatA/TatE family subunit [Chloroflexota bacterium]MCI0817702.1 twin-arginine translocase TatA/TatE family subunit [Chloroflexota bacterium]MCI0820468.1 twin-arginine translocase TatA/TatE family subunit [Chloroflexota bacterium]